MACRRISLHSYDPSSHLTFPADHVRVHKPFLLGINSPVIQEKATTATPTTVKTLRGINTQPLISQEGMWRIKLGRHRVCQTTVILSNTSEQPQLTVFYSSCRRLLSLMARLQVQRSSLNVKIVPSHINPNDYRPDKTDISLCSLLLWLEERALSGKGWDGASPVWLSATQSKQQTLHMETTNSLIP